MIFFILGSHPELSIAELKSVLGDHYRPVFVSRFVVVIQPTDHNLGELQERLAGIVKLGRIVGEQADWNQQEAADLLASLASGAAGKNKISFGLSVYEAGDTQTTRSLERELDRLGLEIKKRLKETQRPVRYVKGKEPRLSSAIVQTNGLLESGGEFVLLVTESKILLGQTEAIQDFKAWSDRDFGRPARDAKSGMLPPKLARIMINLGGIEPQGASLLDPFCGSGTVLMEAALMGFSTVIGSDISEKAIDDSQTNMDWLRQQVDLSHTSISLHCIPAAKLPSVHTDQVDTIVAEVFLGNPRRQTIDLSEAHMIESELLPLFQEAFASLKPLLSPRGSAVIAFPAFKTHSGYWHRLPLQPLVEKLGYVVQDTYLYHRSNQFVARDIYVLRHA